MRLVRFGPAGRERPGFLQGDRVIDLVSIFPDIPDIGQTFFRDGWLEKVRDVSAGDTVTAERLGCPIQQTSKIICLGINYLDHSKEGGLWSWLSSLYQYRSWGLEAKP